MIEELSKIQTIYRNHSLDENKEFFYEKRNRYNELKVNGNNAENLEKAVLFIFLNKTCFNGLYRVNSKGLFNVPFNNAKNPLLCDEDNLKVCSKFLQNVEMKTGDYKECKSFIGDMGVPAKAVGCSALRYRSSSSLRCGGLLRRCSIA